MRRVLPNLIVFAASAGFAAAASATESCPQYFADGAMPALMNPVMKKDGMHLCFPGYSVYFWGVSRTALWAAEYVTSEQVAMARKMDREDDFHAEPRLPYRWQSAISDFIGTCKDKGHLVASGNAPDAYRQRATYSMANIVAQHPLNNQVLWSGVESAVRNLISRRGPMYIITGPMFEGQEVRTLPGGRTMIPTHLYKAVYDKERGQAGAYVTVNGPVAHLEVISIAQLERRFGVNLFPGMPSQVKAVAMDLPPPTKSRHASSTRKPRKGCSAQDLGVADSATGQSSDTQQAHAPIDYEKAAMKGLKYFLKH